MSKKKKDKSRPVYICPKCKMLWVHDTEYLCCICKVKGEPQNDGARKTLKKVYLREE